MKSNKTKQAKINRNEQALQINNDNFEKNKNGSAQKDGFRYDYNDNF